MKKYYLLLFLGLFLQQSHLSFASETKTVLRYYNSTGGSFFYRQPDIVRQAARFSLTSPSYLRSISILLGGNSVSGQATVHIYGHEGGVAAPVVGKELIPSFTIYKTISGPQKITVEFPEKIPLDNNQFFIVVDSLSAGTVLLSDHIGKPPFCSSSDGGTFTYQALQTSDGRWFYGQYAYYIDADVEYRPQYSSIFERDSLVLHNGAIYSDIHSSNLNCTDVNKDGYLDLMVGTTILMNDGTGKFTTVEPVRHKSEGREIGIFIDIDNDGWEDVLVIDIPTDSSMPRHKILLNENGRFKESTILLPVIKNPTTFSVADINADGFPDVFIGQNTVSSTEPLSNYLLVNNKDLTFTDRTILIEKTQNTISTCKGAAFVDINNDGYIDLSVTNYSANQPDEIWLNRNNEVFTRSITDSKPGYSAGCFWADIDNNGSMDALIARRGNSAGSINGGTQLYLNEVSGHNIRLTQAEVAQLPAFEERHSGGAIADINNDGRQDYILLTSCQCRYADLYVQSGEGNFELKTNDYGLDGLAGNQDALWVDVNNDGSLDLVIIDKGQLVIYRNKAGLGNYVQVDLQSTGAKKSAVGSQVQVFTKDGMYTRQVISGRGLLMQDPSRLHFGLGKTDTIDSVLVTWPGTSGQTEKFTNLEVNKVHQLKGGSGSIYETGKLEILVNARPNPFSNEVTISYSLDHAADISITIYDAQGRTINEIYSGRQEAGNHSVLWNRKDHTGMRVAPGLYMYSYTIDGHQTIKALTVID